jgi:hypothetical protein
VWEGRRLQDITAADLRQIVDSGVGEHLQLEYKSELKPMIVAAESSCKIFVCSPILAEVFCSSGLQKYVTRTDSRPD